MAQNTAPVGKLSAKPQAPAVSRLILQDPLAFDQAIQPQLRSSLEMVVEPTNGMDREKARDLWESLSLEPEVAQERQAERKRLFARTEQLAKESAQAKAETAALHAELAKSQDQRFNHPLIYAGAAGLLGLGALWWLERRKRKVLEEQQLQDWSRDSFSHDKRNQLSIDQSYLEHAQADVAESVFALEEAPASERVAAEPALEERIESSYSSPEWTNRSRTASSNDAKPDSASVAAQATEEELLAHAWQKPDRGLSAFSKRIFGSAIGRRSQPIAVNTSSYDLDAERSGTHNAEQTTALQSGHSAVSTQLLHDEDTQFQAASMDEEQQLSPAYPPQYNTDQENIDLLSRTRVKASLGEDAVEHLLELRMAVSGLCALGRPSGAKKLLQEHIDSSPDTCAWAYLECMNLCEQLDQREEFETLRKRYREQFNRMAPYWQEPNAKVISLDGYARATHELCIAWAQGREPAHAILATWLAGPLIARKLVQLPAYHDMFDLYELLEFAQAIETNSSAVSETDASQPNASDAAPMTSLQAAALGQETGADFVPTVSLLDLDYEFSSDVTLQEGEVAQSEKAVTIVKPGNFSVDFNVTGTQHGGLFSRPADLDKK